MELLGAVSLASMSTLLPAGRQALTCTRARSCTMGTVLIHAVGMVLHVLIYARGSVLIYATGTMVYAVVPAPIRVLPAIDPRPAVALLPVAGCPCCPP